MYFNVIIKFQTQNHGQDWVSPGDPARPTPQAGRLVGHASNRGCQGSHSGEKYYWNFTLTGNPPFPIPFCQPSLPNTILLSSSPSLYNPHCGLLQLFHQAPPPLLFRKEVSNVESNKVVLGFYNDNCLSFRYPSRLKVSTLREYLHFANVLILPVRSQQLIRAKQSGPVQTHIAQRNFQTSAVWSA